MTTKVFRNGNSQAVRIPKEIQTDLQELAIQKVGNGYILYPVNDPWFPLQLSIGQMPDDFMANREQPSLDDIPEREVF